MELNALEQWLSPLDAAALECDGFSRVASTLLQREKVQHQTVVGSLDVKGVGRIPLHVWLAFDDGSICDFRARMWLGDAESVPHGVFFPGECQTYSVREIVNTAPLSEVIFTILTGLEQSSFAKISYST